jgi:hypothetical protein
MELTLEGHPSFHVEGNVTVNLPSYMKMLTAEEFAEAVAEKDKRLILAVGRDPKSGDVIFMTNRGELEEISSEEHGLPDGDVTPIDFGQTIMIGLEEADSFQMSVEWAL